MCYLLLVSGVQLLCWYLLHFASHGAPQPDLKDKDLVKVIVQTFKVGICGKVGDNKIITYLNLFEQPQFWINEPMGYL